MEITMPDIVQLQREAGAAENDQRLRAIVAERLLSEAQAQLAAFLASHHPTSESP